ncbi:MULTISPECIES: hypothetical protein [Cupriavidus]
MQQRFDWRGVAASAIAGGIGAGIGEAAGAAKWSPLARQVSSGLGAGLASAGVRGDLSAQSLGYIAADLVGNTIGNQVAERLVEGVGREGGVGNALGSSLAGRSSNSNSMQEDVLGQKIAELQQSPVWNDSATLSPNSGSAWEGNFYGNPSAFSYLSDTRVSGVFAKADSYAESDTDRSMSPEDLQACTNVVEDRLRWELAGQEARDASLEGGRLLATGGPARSMPRGGVGNFEMVRNGNWDAALNLAADPMGILGELPALRQDLGKLSQLQAEGRIEAMRQAMNTAGVQNVPSYSEAWSVGPDGVATNVRDYGATAENMQRVYEDFVRDQRLKETWGEDYKNLRIGKSQMDPIEFEKRVLDVHQQVTDAAYKQGVDAIARGKLEVTEGGYAKALGTFIDGRVRDQLRAFAAAEGLSDSAASSIWAVNRRIKSDLVPGWGIPDNRLGTNLYADTTLARKSAYTPQIMKWNEIRPGNVLIIRPTELGGAYAIPRNSIPQFTRAANRGM